MFSVKFKIKDKSNSLPRKSSRQNGSTNTNSLPRVRRSSNSSLKSSLASSNGGGKANAKDRRVRIVTTRERATESGKQ
jgi:hypothetical protein